MVKSLDKREKDTDLWLEAVESKGILGIMPENWEADSRIFGRLLDDDKVVASYKMYWLLGILEEVSAGNTEIEFRRITARMIASAWYPQLQYKLSFGSFDNLKKPIGYAALKYGFQPNSTEKELLEFLCESEDRELQKMMKELTFHVPYRLLSPFFAAELHNVKDSLRNKRITELSSGSDRCLYKIVKGSSDRIVINDCWKGYLQENYKVIKAWIYYKLVCFLQKRNPNVPAIAFKLEAPRNRSLTRASELWKRIIAEKGVKDIYTGREFNENAYADLGVLSIDHFIPWSFVLHDEMWNLVPTFRNINSSKNDKLLVFDRYIDDFCGAQYKAFSYICEKRIKHCVEEYMDVLRLEDPYDYYRCSTREGFSSNIRQCVSPLYQIAVNQGFEVAERVF